MPPESMNNEWARPNNQSNLMNFASNRPHIPQQAWQPVFGPLDEIKMRQHMLLSMNVNEKGKRYCSWNFENVPDDCGTVEFRRPPAVRSSEEANHWISFAIGFVACAIRRNDLPQLAASKGYPTVARLDEDIYRGLHSLSSTSHGALGSLAEDARPARIASPQELASIHQKMEMRKYKTSNFVKEISSRPNSPASFN
ncbi:hypothetical protein BDV19DRAFT_386690 [Aspergillus venezuelensis]